jgi:hypothetical protein
MRNTRHTREQLLHLLTEAAEFEHNLLCCYLYAAFTLRCDGGGLSDTETAAVRRWHKMIVSVAIEEMTHLALVANLTVAIGARPHFNRPNLPVAPGFHPAGIVVELAPFDEATLEHFIFLERPEEVPVDEGPGFEPDAEYERGERKGAALMPAATDYDTIAEFYATIRRTFVNVSKAIGEDRLFVGSKAMQVGEDVVKLEGLTAVTDLESALQAIDTIVVQGEGASAGVDDSHFARFTAIKDEYAKLLAQNPKFSPAWPAARNPVMRAPIEPGERVHVNDARAAAMLDIANALYNQMLRLLTQAWGRQNADVAAKRALLDAAMSIMGVVSVVSAHLATLPARESDPGVNAGITFAIFRAVEPLCEGPAEWRITTERLAQLGAGMRAVGAGVAKLEEGAKKLEDLAKSFAAGPA